MDIKLVDLTEKDIELVRTWRNSPEVAAYMYTDSQITKEDQERWFERTKDDSSSKYWIIEYNDQKVGLASLTGISSTFSSCYWAFYLGDPSAKGGLGAKIEYNVINYVFDVLKLNKLRCEVFVFNEKVTQLHEKFGFRREAYYRQHVKKNGKFEDVVGLALLKADWEAIKDSLKHKVYRGKA
ncbi:UDP-4-amino-4,6-dideoxy-N-acetyl-beta-L-altrosamine N-acetyltransferase [Solitalea longa]|uniref:UDP-4-amino-4, 6-dideoxy-N-acetyl-beta-L-altrosamine N-acetyltransferase n=1 Tax=Solitalea longa TaxID=2079460 RepID=A0A2S5AA11_9SPHI|nr:UDP-4-amino-4,6-dideoxy-N-acetyl-beta-L-altrosamine N-acetyltransferase [Solitalea longa]POY39119.1 UDP-4-amino-4,6-dideoxy-N-acetyl-beta-L-altrosamine N-acetyltransferase [Solitalea longa]